jgi:hypothetical protein
MGSPPATATLEQNCCAGLASLAGSWGSGRAGPPIPTSRSQAGLQFSILCRLSQPISRLADSPCTPSTGSVISAQGQNCCAGLASLQRRPRIGIAGRDPGAAADEPCGARRAPGPEHDERVGLSAGPPSRQPAWGAFPGRSAPRSVHGGSRQPAPESWKPTDREECSQRAEPGSEAGAPAAPSTPSRGFPHRGLVGFRTGGPPILPPSAFRLIARARIPAARRPAPRGRGTPRGAPATSPGRPRSTASRGRPTAAW